MIENVLARVNEETGEQLFGIFQQHGSHSLQSIKLPEAGWFHCRRKILQPLLGDGLKL